MMTAKDITFRIANTLILDHVSLNIVPGQLHVILGPNGAGKSTFMHILTGSKRADSGTIIIDGKDIDKYEAKELARKRAFLTQHPDVPFIFRSVDIVMLGRYPHPPLSRSEDISLAYSCLEMVDADHLAGRIYNTLSGGEKQRVQIARILAQLHTEKRPLYLLLDEPTSSLDIAHQSILLERLSDMKSSGIAVLACLHDLNLALLYADTISLLKNGKLLFSGSTEELQCTDYLKTTFETELQFVKYSAGLAVMPVKKKKETAIKLAKNNIQSSDQNTARKKQHEGDIR